MKISVTPQLQPDPPVMKNRRTISTETDFQTVLKQSVARTAGENRTLGITNPFGPQSVRPIVRLETVAALPLTDRIDRLVDQLENYRFKLADPQASLTSIQPLLNDMVASSEKLIPKLEQLDERDPLKEILNRSLVMVSVEVARFNRGDYL